MRSLFLLTVAAAVAAASPALQGANNASPQLLTYSVDVPLPDVRYDGGLCTVSPDGSSKLRLTPPRPMRDVAWSPDGRRVAYVRPSPGEVGPQVFVANPDGGGERNLSRGVGAFSADPAWSPDGRQVAFTAWSLPGIPRIAVAASDGSSRRQLSLRLTGNPVQPAWAPNGRQLAVVVSPTPSSAPRDLYVVEVDGSASRLLATQASEPAWSPDGTRIAYVSSGDLIITSVDGSGGRAVGVTASSPAWSPDGRLIAFVRGDDLLVVRPDGSGQRVVVPGPLPVRGPAWRPATDLTVGPKSPCILEGTSRADALRGTSSAEIIVGGSGADTIFGGAGEDVVLAGSGDDFVSGQGGRDRLVGGFGRDRLYGGRGDDFLYGRDAQSDLLDGGPGHDGAFHDPGVVAATDRLRSVEARLGRP